MSAASEAIARQQEAEMLAALGQTNAQSSRGNVPAPAPAGEDPRAKFVVGWQKQRRDLKATGLSEWEIDCEIAQLMEVEPPPKPADWSNAPKVAVGSIEDGTAAEVPAPLPVAQLHPPAGGEMASAAPHMLKAWQEPPPAVEPIEMTDEEMAAAIARVRAAKVAVASGEELLAEVQGELEAARAELADAKRMVAAGTAWLTQ